MRKERTNLELRTIKRNDGQLEWLPRNPRQWTQTDIDNTARSIAEDEDFLEDRPLLVTPNGDEYIVFAGNLRREGAKKQKMKTVPAVVYYPETDEDRLTVKRRAMKDNGSFGAWDYDALANEWDDLPLQDWGVPAWDTEKETPPATATEDDFNEDTDNVETRCKRGEVWVLGDHRLMCGDSTDANDVERLMNGSRADMAFTDPPYGVEYTGGIQFKANGEVVKDNREMIKNDDADIYASVFPMLSKFVRGACYVWFAETRAASLYNAAQKCGEIHALIIWVKNGGYGALNANYKQKHEPCLYWKPKNGTLNFIGPTTETTIWEINKDGVNEYHPTQKPVALAAKAIGNHKADAVLDLFGGSGSTLIACEQLGRKCYMMELDEHYCDVILARWEKLTGKTAERAEN